MSGTEVEAADFLVNKVLFWISLLVSVGAAAGIGFKVAAWLRKKVNEDKNELRTEIRTGLEGQRKMLEDYIQQIAKPAAERRDRQEFLIEQINKRMDTLEQQQSMQLQLILQNQTAIREFIDEYKKRNGFK